MSSPHYGLSFSDHQESSVQEVRSVFAFCCKPAYIC